MTRRAIGSNKRHGWGVTFDLVAATPRQQDRKAVLFPRSSTTQVYLVSVFGGEPILSTGWLRKTTPMCRQGGTKMFDFRATDPEYGSGRSEWDEILNDSEKLLGVLESPAFARAFLDNPDRRIIRDVLVLTVRVARLSAMSADECQMAVPYAPMKQIRQPDGSVVLCCNHDPEHCTPVGGT